MKQQMGRASSVGCAGDPGLRFCKGSYWGARSSDEASKKADRTAGPVLRLKMSFHLIYLRCCFMMFILDQKPVRIHPRPSKADSKQRLRESTGTTARG